MADLLPSTIRQSFADSHDRYFGIGRGSVEEFLVASNPLGHGCHIWIVPVAIADEHIRRLRHQETIRRMNIPAHSDRSH